MRPDTKEISDMMDKSADLIEQNDLEAAQKLLPKIIELITQWVERHLSP